MLMIRWQEASLQWVKILTDVRSTTWLQHIYAESKRLAQPHNVTNRNMIY